MIKAVFFDVGGVLIQDDAVEILKRQSQLLSIPYRELRDELRADHVLLMKGVITRREYLRRLARRFQLPPIRIQELKSLFPRYRYFRNNWAVAKRLRENGYRVGIITNVTPPLPFGPRLKLFPLFRPVIRSWQVKSVKPERRIFEIARRRAAVKFSQMAFFDDRERNVKAARKLGIQAFVYKNPGELMRQLRRHGVKI